MPIQRKDGRFVYTGPAATLSAIAPDPDALSALLETCIWLDEAGVLDHVCAEPDPDNPCPVTRLGNAFRPFWDYIQDDIPALAMLVHLGQTTNGMLVHARDPEVDLLDPKAVADTLDEHFRELFGAFLDGDDDTPTA